VALGLKPIPAKLILFLAGRSVVNIPTLSGATDRPPGRQWRRRLTRRELPRLTFSAFVRLPFAFGFGVRAVAAFPVAEETGGSPLSFLLTPSLPNLYDVLGHERMFRIACQRSIVGAGWPDVTPSELPDKVEADREGSVGLLL
jgi:hypothetical protein